MEFKSKKIPVDIENPFEHDKLDRKPEVDNLSLLLRNISSPIVLSVNAPWGSGKTTFLEMLHAELINNESKSIYFNAWETDFAKDPLIAFLGEMNQALELYLTECPEKNLAWKKAKKAGAHILKKGIPALVKVSTAGVIDTEELIEVESSEFMGGLAKDLIDEYSNNKSAIKIFKDNVSKILVDEDGEISKLFIFVDELDRCRPTYSIELLERIKHLLDIEGLVFILALDKQQLAHSVKGIYGTDFDALGYLRRFIDIEYTLRRPELDKFIDQIFENYEFTRFFESRVKYQGFSHDEEYLKNTFKVLAKAKKLSLREVEQLFAKVNLVILSTSEDTYIYPAFLAFLLVTKEFHPGIYQGYIQEKGSTKDIVQLLYTIFPENVRYESHECAIIEGLVIAAKRNDYEDYSGDALEIHNKLLLDKDASSKSINYSTRVIRIVNRPVKEVDNSVSLDSIVNRIEMLGQYTFGSSER